VLLRLGHGVLHRHIEVVLQPGPHPIELEAETRANGRIGFCFCNLAHAYAAGC
jgi:hypothetical protein